MGKLLDATKSGDKREFLVALRDELAEATENTTSGRDSAALSKRLIEVYEMIEALPDPDGPGDPVESMARLVDEFNASD